MPKFQAKPVIIEAEQFHATDLPLPFQASGAVSFDGDSFYVETMHNRQKCILENGDWVVPEPNGVNFYPIKDSVFQTKYDKIDD
jgi:hypothetical protein